MNNIKCPQCGSLVEITEVLKKELKEESLAEAEKELRVKIEAEQKTELLDLKKALEEKDKKVEEMMTQELKLREILFRLKPLVATDGINMTLGE